MSSRQKVGGRRSLILWLVAIYALVLILVLLVVAPLSALHRSMEATRFQMMSAAVLLDDQATSTRVMQQSQDSNTVTARTAEIARVLAAAEAFVRAADWERAIEAYAKALALDPSRQEAATRLKELRLTAEAVRVKAANDTLQDEIRKAYADGVAYAEADDWVKAAERFAWVVAYSPNYQDAATRLTDGRARVDKSATATAQVAQLNATGTAQAEQFIAAGTAQAQQLKATGTAQAKQLDTRAAAVSTREAMIHAFDAVQAQRTATVIAQQTATIEQCTHKSARDGSRWPMVICDPFDTNLANWDTGEKQDADKAVWRLLITEGKYRWEVEARDITLLERPWPWTAIRRVKSSNDPVSVFYLAVDARQVLPQKPGSYGVEYRSLDDRSAYTFLIKNDQFAIMKQTERSSTPLSNWARNQNLRVGQGNRLTIVGENQLVFYINDELVAIDSTRMVGDGRLSLVAEVDPGTIAGFEFDNWELRVPPR